MKMDRMSAKADRRLKGIFYYNRKANPILKECNFHIACDVTNPLCGKNGATYIYGSQKGVTPEIAEELDQAMNHYDFYYLQISS